MSIHYPQSARIEVAISLSILIFLIASLDAQAQVEYFVDGPIKQQIFIEPQPNELSMSGRINIGTINPTSEVQFANIFLFIPGPDTIIWLIQNFPITPDSGSLGIGEPYVLTSLEFDMDPLQLLPPGHPQMLSELHLAFPNPTLNPYLLPITIPGPTAFVPIPVEPEFQYILPNSVLPELSFDPILGLPLPPPPLFDISWEPPVILPPVLVMRGCHVPNIDLDNKTHASSATYAGDLNACVPAGTANSFMWLRSQHNEIDSLLKIAHGEGDTAHRNALEDISAKMNRVANSGVTSFNHAKGKQTFVDMYKLPVKVKFQSILYNNDILSGDDRYGHSADNQNSTDRNVDPCWIIDEMVDGEDVELNYQCYWVDSLGNIRPDDPSTPNTNESYTNKHCVTMSDGVKVFVGPANIPVIGFRFKHDLNQDSLSGTTMEWSWTKTVTIGGKDFIELTGKSGRKIVVGGTTYTRRCIVTDAMSESFCATVSYDSIPCPSLLTLTSDTLCSGVYKADTICLSDIVVKGGQDVLFKCNVIKVDPTFTQLMPTSTIQVDTSGCP